MSQSSQPVIAEASPQGAPPPGAPSSKEKKYDRQLRLWGANGQAALENAHIALVNATAAGTETLKNLVLPGVGKFTIIDDQKVDEEDLGCNFFLDAESLGQSRAKAATEKLQELNPDTQGAYIEGSFADLLEKSPEIFSAFTIFLISSPVSSANLLKLQELNPSTPIFHIYSVGFSGAFRISLPEITIVETHPESIVDLRLFNPWDELLEFAKSKTENLEGQTDHQHGHIPYVLLLLYYLKAWKDEKGSYPSTYKEKNELKKIITAGMRTNVPGGSEENYEEAVAAVLNNVKKHEIPRNLRSVFEDEKCEILTADSSSFWIIAKAIKEFIGDQGLLPLTGTVPDMKAESDVYVMLQKIYRKKSQKDISKVHETVQALLKELGREESEIARAEVETFVKNAFYVRCLRLRSLKDEYGLDELHSKSVASALAMDPDSPIALAVAYKGYQKFWDEHSHAPGEDDAKLEADELQTILYIREYLKTVLQNVGKEDSHSIPPLVEKWAKELVRAGGSELHNVSALIGGIVAQEVIKVITKQYIPANNTVVLDAIVSRTAVYEF